MASSRPVLYVANEKEFLRYANRLKLQACPHCKACGFLIRHGYLRGYGSSGNEKILRGWRIFCSNRNLKTGCGKTYCLILVLFLYRRIVNASQLWNLLKGFLNGLSILTAFTTAAICFHPGTGYKLWAAFKRNQSHIRTCLHRLNLPPPRDLFLNPSIELIVHLQLLRNLFESSH